MSQIYTGVLGSISTKFFARPDTVTVDDTCMQPDIEVNLDNKDAAWQFLVEKYGKIAKKNEMYYNGKSE